MMTRGMVVLMSLLILGLNFSACGATGGGLPPAGDEVRIVLPEPRYSSDVSVEEALLERRSVRSYAQRALSLEEVSQLLWAAQGMTDPRGFRAAPSAGATYPLEVYVVVGDVEGVAQGIYRYLPQQHELVRVVAGDLRGDLARAALNQQWVADGAIDIVFTAVYERTTMRYGKRGIRYVHMEAGHAAQNVYLQAVALKLGTVVIGAFDDSRVTEILKLPGGEVPLYIMPVGKLKD